MEDDNVSPAEKFRKNTPGATEQLSYAGIPTFLKSEYRDIDDISDSDVAVLGIPYDGGVTNRPGARYGPRAIRDATGWWSFLIGYKGKFTNMQTEKQSDFNQFSIVDCGDVPVFPMDWKKTAESVSAYVETIAKQGVFPLVLGGDHYPTYPSFKGFAEGSKHENIGLIQIDAHTGTTTESTLFGKNFHGSSTQQIANSPFSDYENISHIGIRGYRGPNYFDFVNETGLNFFTMNDIREQGIRSVTEKALSAVTKNTDAVYVTFDIDGIDPSAAPGTGTPLPGGISSEDALILMEVLGNHDSVQALDLMEVAPQYDPTEGTQKFAAYLLVTFLENKFAGID